MPESADQSSCLQQIPTRQSHSCEFASASMVPASASPTEDTSSAYLRFQKSSTPRNRFADGEITLTGRLLSCRDAGRSSRLNRHAAAGVTQGVSDISVWSIRQGVSDTCVRACGRENLKSVSYLAAEQNSNRTQERVIPH
jgi:hypothetical protein